MTRNLYRAVERPTSTDHFEALEDAQRELDAILEGFVMDDFEHALMPLDTTADDGLFCHDDGTDDPFLS